MNFVILQDLQFDLKNVSKWKILFASTLSRLNGHSVMTDEEWDKMDFKAFWSGKKGITWFNEPFWMRGSCELMNHSS